jgi:thiamine pyrophosphate-dependent acetolactate synthase large subunit-like protein
MKPSSSIWTAAQTNDIDSITTRIEQNASLASKLDAYGYSALHYAAQHNHIQIVQLLLTKGCPADANSCGATPLHRASYAGSTEACRLLLVAGADVNSIDTSFNDHGTPLHKAYSGAHVEVVKLLLQHGADPLLLDAAGKTPEQLLKKKHAAKFGALQEESPQRPEDDLAPAKDSDVAVAVDDATKTVADASSTGPPSSSPDPIGNVGLECQQCRQQAISFTRLSNGTLLCLDCKYQRS